MYFDVDYALKKILKDQHLEDKFFRMDEVIEESKKEERHLLDPGAQ